MLTDDRKMPDYATAVSIDNSRRILEALSEKGGVATFSELQMMSGVKGSVLNHHLNRLQRLEVIQREVKGTYRLTYRTPLCFIFNPKQKIPVAYFGLLGQSEDRQQPEPQVAIQLLEKEKLKPELMYVVTSLETLNGWKPMKLQYQWILCYDDEIANVEAVKRKITPQLLSLLRDYIVVMDCTSATKPATIAYYELAQKLWIPLMYLYEQTKQLKWLISRENIEEKINMYRVKW